jgi:hypothetical protein
VPKMPAKWVLPGGKSHRRGTIFFLIEHSRPRLKHLQTSRMRCIAENVSSGNPASLAIQHPINKPWRNAYPNIVARTRDKVKKKKRAPVLGRGSTS